MKGPRCDFCYGQSCLGYTRGRGFGEKLASQEEVSVKMKKRDLLNQNDENGFNGKISFQLFVWSFQFHILN